MKKSKLTIINVPPGEQPPKGFIKMNRKARRALKEEVEQAKEYFKKEN